MSEYDDDDFDDLEPPSSGIAGAVLPILTAVVALLVGVVAGGLITWVFTRVEPEVVEVARDLTDDELLAACAPFVETAAENLEEATQKVATLEGQVKSKEARVQELEAEMKKRSSRGAQLVQELHEARAELETLRAQLERAVEEKEELLVELKKTQEELVVQKEETRLAREDALGNKWTTFRNQAQLDICEKGGRKKMGRCREHVLALMNASMREKYTYCIRSGQSVPSLHELGKGETLPEYAEFLDQDSKISRDWYLLLCDPTLPEAKDLKEVERLLTAETLGIGDGEPMDDLDFEDLDELPEE